MNDQSQPATAAAPPEAAPISFERLPGESAKAFAAFMVYLKLGPERSNTKTSRKHRKAIALINTWSSKWQWVERAAAFDEHFAKIEQAALEERARQDAEKWAIRLNRHRERRFQIGTMMLDRAEQLLKGRRRFDPAAADRLAKVGDALIGLSVGAPTASLAVGGTAEGEAIPMVASVGTVNVYLPEKKPLPDEKEFQAYKASQKDAP